MGFLPLYAILLTALGTLLYTVISSCRRSYLSTAAVAATVPLPSLPSSSMSFYRIRRVVGVYEICITCWCGWGWE
ncbi:uncharacterized protein K452DRAFT_292023 [Aplosporella prunicola CBS 121167]|uniref:Uncharacterized protein n=1 Tax=Aplosporella prunicola CBS 121167 TaxID=1176127 RepID=A0A6A6B0Y5_9PEZI|nr:uncharacterized protein K452DRAFT_292023 [Aplosporella prunicola CBS 121167]KAF2136884.1 hypothetical protein K452DRAFT_292023 [Aplosporella prunicola CBS 121167]